MKPQAVDLCCGRGAVTRALLAAGYQVIGVDIIQHPDYPASEAQFILGDVRHIEGRQFTNCLFMWASPPCDEFARWQMPWTRRRATEPALDIVAGCYRIRSEAQPKFFILENVRAAQRWLGPALLQRAGRYLWGDACLAPIVCARPKESFPGSRPDLRSEVPFDLVYTIAMAVKQ